MKPIQFKFPSWVVFQRSQEIEGTWVAHVLAFDIVTQGQSLQEAMYNAVDATSMAIVDDIEQGLDPSDRKAPPECWEKLRAMLKNGRALPLDQVIQSQSKTKSMAMELQFEVLLVNADAKAPQPARLQNFPMEPPALPQLDLAWVHQPAACA